MAHLGPVRALLRDDGVLLALDALDHLAGEPHHLTVQFDGMNPLPVLPVGDDDVGIGGVHIVGDVLGLLTTGAEPFDKDC